VTGMKSNKYSFPKGKTNENESGIDCAVREVWEEIGLNISKLISENVQLNYK